MIFKLICGNCGNHVECINQPDYDNIIATSIYHCNFCKRMKETKTEVVEIVIQLPMSPAEQQEKR